MRKHLTPMELNILQLVIQGYTNKQIANTMGRSIKTIKNHITTIYQKYGVSRRNDLKKFFDKSN